MLSSSPDCRDRRAGFTLLEVAIVLSLLVIGLGMFTQTFASVMRLHPLAADESLALSAARNVAETVRATPVADVFASFNADAADDPGGAGTALGSAFDVEGAGRRLDHPAGLPGTVRMPTIAGELREDLVDADLGMPRDLNDDGVIDAADHRGDYVILPVIVRVRWVDKHGEHIVDLNVTVTDTTTP